MSTGSTETPESSLHFTKSIEEIDRRLQSMEDRKPTLDMTMKDPSVYEHKADSWLRHHLNSLKQNRRMSDTENLQPMDAYQMKRGYTADVIERRPKAQKENTSRTPKMERRSTLFRCRFRVQDIIRSNCIDSCCSYFLKIVKRFSLSIAAKANRVPSFQLFLRCLF